MILFDWKGSEIKEIIPLEIVIKPKDDLKYIINGKEKRIEIGYDNNLISFEGFNIKLKSCLNEEINWDITHGYFKAIQID